MSKPKVFGITRRTRLVSSRSARSGRRERLSNCYAKKWNPVFSKDRNFKEDESWVESKRKFNAVGDDISIFFEEFESSVPSCQVEEVREYYQGVGLEGLKSQAGTVEGPPAAWLDDRSLFPLICGRSVREHEKRRNAVALYLSLKIPVWPTYDFHLGTVEANHAYDSAMALQIRPMRTDA